MERWKDGKIKAWKNGNWGREIRVDSTVKNSHSKDYHALMVPGGVDESRSFKNE